MKTHNYQVRIEWTGNRGSGTTSYDTYERSHTIRAEGKPLIEATSDPMFMGDPGKYNPEELFLASLSSCHMLWFLHLCADSGVIVTRYEDDPEGILTIEKDGGGKFTHVTLKPVVTVLEERMRENLNSIHQQANKKCFIANSCNFTIEHRPVSGI